MPDQGVRTDPFSDLLSLVAGPIAAVIRSFEQIRKGSDELMRGLENFNNTMESLNDTVARVNRLLNEFEEPIRTLMPQVTRTLKLADDLALRMSGPVDQVIPGLTRLADTLNSPVFAALPTDLGSFLDTINDLVRRLTPLTQIAESAGGLFGGIRFPGLPRSGVPAPRPAATSAAAPPSRREAAPATPARAPAPARRPTGSDAGDHPRRPTAKKATAKRSAKKPTAKKAATKVTAKRATSKRTPAKAASPRA